MSLFLQICMSIWSGHEQVWFGLIYNFLEYTFIMFFCQMCDQIRNMIAFTRFVTTNWI